VIGVGTRRKKCAEEKESAVVGVVVDVNANNAVAKRVLVPLR